MPQVVRATRRSRAKQFLARLLAAVCAAALSWTGCVPHPIYRNSPGSEAASSRPARASRATASSSAKPLSSSARAVDPKTISTRGAYQVGVASCYGEKFHGRKTANGETFNMYKLTAAHRVLPLGTKVRVTHMSNGLSVVVKVNDRGPFIEGRILDLSFAAALELEMVTAGTAEVMIEVVEAVD